MAVIKIHHIALFLFIAGMAKGGINPLPDCTLEQVEVCGKIVESVDESKLCEGTLDEAKTCWDALFENCTGTADQIKTKTDSLDIIAKTKESCDKEAASSSCSNADVNKCEGKLASFQKSNSFCRTWDSHGGCMTNLTVNCLNETVRAYLDKSIMESKKNFTDQKCCREMELSKCRENHVEITNSTATSENCMPLKARKACWSKIMCEEKEKADEIKKAIADNDGFIEICEAAGYNVDGGDSGNSIQPTLMLLLSAFVCTIYSLSV